MEIRKDNRTIIVKRQKDRQDIYIKKKYAKIDRQRQIERSKKKDIAHIDGYEEEQMNGWMDKTMGAHLRV